MSHGPVISKAPLVDILDPRGRDKLMPEHTSRVWFYHQPLRRLDLHKMDKATVRCSHSFTNLLDGFLQCVTNRFPDHVKLFFYGAFTVFGGPNSITRNFSSEQINRKLDLTVNYERLD
jgi:hypothetical protein